MRLTFGMQLDGTEWSREAASVGEMRVGPLGLLDVLETHMGLLGLHDHPARRIDQYRTRVEACDHADAWFHQSFQADPWSTAKHLLALRDELIGAGWDGTAGEDDGPRLRALAEIERQQLPLSAGFGDRLIAAMNELNHWKSLPISRIILTERRNELPPIFDELFKLLEGMNVSIDQAAIMPTGDGESNPALVQCALAGSKENGDLQQDDDSLLLIECSDEWEAAEHVARWLAATGPSDETRISNADVTILCPGDSGVLDAALRRYGLPRIGRSESSRWRMYLQVLPLVLANAWKPVDVRRLVEFLTLDPSPVPGPARGLLLDALKVEPGISGGKWREAMINIPQAYQKSAAAYGKTITDAVAGEIADTIDRMLAQERFDAETGIPEEHLRARCQWVIDAFARHKEQEEELREAVAQAREMQRLSEGKGLLRRIEVERMLDSVIGTGTKEITREREAAPWRVITHPEQAIDSCGTLIWWNFVAEDPPARTWWSPKESESLAARGARLEDSATLLGREAGARRRALLCARDAVLLFAPERLRGEEVWPNPLWDDVRIAAKKLRPDTTDKHVRNIISRRCSSLAADGVWSLATRTLPLTGVRPVPLPGGKTEFAVPMNTVERPQRLSYSAMSDMIGCPMKWTLQSHARLVRPAAQELPDLRTMIGNLSHRIVKRLYSDTEREWTPDSAAAEVARLFDELLPVMASELLLAGSEVALHRYRSTVVAAIRTLVQEIDRLGLVVEASEQEIETEYEGLRFKGYIDLVCRDERGERFVIDLKWASSETYYGDLVEEGRALQLASYAWLLKARDVNDGGETDAGSNFSDGAYFLLAKGELLGASEKLGQDALDSTIPPEEIWQRGRRSWEARYHELQRGITTATGVEENLIGDKEGMELKAVRNKLKESASAAELLYVQPPCRFCHFSTLCGVRREAE